MQYIFNSIIKNYGRTRDCHNEQFEEISKLRKNLKHLEKMNCGLKQNLTICKDVSFKKIHDLTGCLEKSSGEIDILKRELIGEEKITKQVATELTEKYMAQIKHLNEKLTKNHDEHIVESDSDTEYNTEHHFESSEMQMEDSSSKSSSEIDPSTKSSNEIDSPIRYSSEIDPSTTSSSEIYLSTKSLSETDPSTKSLSETDPSTKSSNKIDSSTISSSEIDSATTSSSETDPLTKSLSETDPLTKSSSETDPSTKSSSEINSSTKSSSEIYSSTKSSSKIYSSTKSSSETDPSTKSSNEIDSSTKSLSEIYSSTKSSCETDPPTKCLCKIDPLTKCMCEIDSPTSCLSEITSSTKSSSEIYSSTKSSCETDPSSKCLCKINPLTKCMCEIDSSLDGQMENNDYCNDDETKSTNLLLSSIEEYCCSNESRDLMLLLEKCKTTICNIMKNSDARNAELRRYKVDAKFYLIKLREEQKVSAGKQSEICAMKTLNTLLMDELEQMKKFPTDNELKDELKNMQCCLKMRMEDNKCLNNDLCQMKELLEKSDKINKNMECKISQMEIELKNYETLKRSCDENYNNLSIQCCDLQLDLATEKKENREKVKTIDDLREKMHCLNDVIKGLNSQMLLNEEKANAKIDDLTTKKDRVAYENKQLKNDIVKLCKYTESMQYKQADMERKNSELEADKRKLTRNIDNLKEELKCTLENEIKVEKMLSVANKEVKLLKMSIECYEKTAESERQKLVRAEQQLQDTERAQLSMHGWNQECLTFVDTEIGGIPLSLRHDELSLKNEEHVKTNALLCDKIAYLEESVQTMRCANNGLTKTIENYDEEAKIWRCHTKSMGYFDSQTDICPAVECTHFDLQTDLCSAVECPHDDLQTDPCPAVECPHDDLQTDPCPAVECPHDDLQTDPCPTVECPHDDLQTDPCPAVECPPVCDYSCDYPCDSKRNSDGKDCEPAIFPDNVANGCDGAVEAYDSPNTNCNCVRVAGTNSDLLETNRLLRCELDEMKQLREQIEADVVRRRVEIEVEVKRYQDEIKCLKQSCEQTEANANRRRCEMEWKLLNCRKDIESETVSKMLELTTKMKTYMATVAHLEQTLQECRNELSQLKRDSEEFKIQEKLKEENKQEESLKNESVFDKDVSSRNDCNDMIQEDNSNRKKLTCKKKKIPPKKMQKKPFSYGPRIDLPCCIGSENPCNRPQLVEKWNNRRAAMQNLQAPKTVVPSINQHRRQSAGGNSQPPLAVKCTLSNEMIAQMGKELNKRAYTGNVYKSQSMSMRYMRVGQIRSGETSHRIVEFISNVE